MKMSFLRPTTIAAALLLYAVFCQAQRGFMWVSKDASVDEFSKIIKDSICNDCVYEYDKGYVPTIYHWVEYNYGEPSPDYTEIIRSYYTHGFPDTIRGWVVSDSLLFSMSGDCAFASFDLTEICTNKINSLLPMYKERMNITIPGCGNDDEKFSIEIYTTKEEMKRREQVINSEVFK